MPTRMDHRCYSASIGRSAVKKAGASILLLVMIFSLSGCSLFNILPSSRNQPTNTVRPIVTSARTATPLRSMTPGRTTTPTTAVSARVSKAKSILTSSTDFDTNLNILNEAVASLLKSLESLNTAKTALAIIDKIKNTTCVVTNCWTVLIKAMDAVASGSGTALSELDGLLRQAIAFKSKLEAVGSLTALRTAASTFRSSATDANLDKMLSQIPTKLSALKTLNQDTGALKNLLAEINSDVALIQKGLATGNQIAQIPGINDLISAIEKVRVAANSAYQTLLNQLTKPLTASISVLDSLQAVK